MNHLHKTLAVSAASALMACGATAVPEAKMTRAVSAVRAAEAVNAEEHPDASLHLKMARDEIERATRHIEDGDDRDAERALDRAEVDAEVALHLARANEAEAEAREALKKVNELRMTTR